jgi:6-phosphogluconolactonase
VQPAGIVAASQEGAEARVMLWPLPKFPLLLFFALNSTREQGMLQKALTLMFALAGIFVCVGCTTTSHYLYATIPSANELAVYREDPVAGVLTQITGSPYTVGDGAHSVVVAPSGQFLYVANPGQDENDVSLFSINSYGQLTEIFPRASVAPLGSQPEKLVMDPSGNYLYVMNAGSNNITVFSIDTKTGVLTEIAGSPFQIGLAPLNMTITPSGKFMFVTASNAPLGLIAGFSVTAGKLQLANLTSSAGLNPFGIAINPAGNYLYIGNTSSNSISVFSISSAGALTQVPESPLEDIYNGPVALQIDPKGQFLYVANQASNNVAVYSITASTGLPVGLTTSTTTFSFITESTPSVLTFDPDGGHLYIGSQATTAGIQAFEVTDGNLNPVFTYKTGNAISSIAVAP